MLYNIKFSYYIKKDLYPVIGYKSCHLKLNQDRLSMMLI